MKILSLLCALSLSACTLGGQSPPSVPQAPNTYTASPDVLASIDEAVATPIRYAPPPPAPPVRDVVVPPPPVAPVSTPPPPVAAKGRRPVAEAREPSVPPTHMIRDALRAAQVEPQRRGYHGGSNTQRFDWQPGKLYKIYVTPGKMTSITLPRGFHLVNEVLLDAEAWHVKSYRVGPEERTQDVLIVMPIPEKGAKDTDIALLTEEGTSFDVTLVVGSVGMFAATWNTPAVPQIVPEDAVPRSQP
jgi:hypothetical protein